MLAAVQGAGGTAVATLSVGSRGAGWRTDADIENATDAVSALLARIGSDPNAFDLEMIAADGLDTMQLGASAGKVAVKGSSGVALASAVNW